LEHFLFSFFNVNVGVEQGSVLSPILSALYLLPIFHIFEKRAKNLKIPVLFLLFIDNSLFISQGKSFEKTNLYLFCSYNVISSLFEQFGLVIKHEKLEIFHFSRSYSLFISPSLDLSCLGDLILYLKET